VSLANIQTRVYIVFTFPLVEAQKLATVHLRFRCPGYPSYLSAEGALM